MWILVQTYIERYICLSFMFANICKYMSESKITIERIRAHLWTIFYTFLTMCLPNWPGKYTRIQFFSFFVLHIVCIPLKDCMVRFWRNSEQQTYCVLLISWSTVRIHFSILSVFSKKSWKKKKLIKWKFSYLLTFLKLTSWICTLKMYI